MSVLQQPEMSLDNGHVCPTAACVASGSVSPCCIGRVCPTNARAAFGRVCPMQQPCAASGRVCPTAATFRHSVLQLFLFNRCRRPDTSGQSTDFC